MVIRRRVWIGRRVPGNSRYPPRPHLHTCLCKSRPRTDWDQRTTTTRVASGKHPIQHRICIGFIISSARSTGTPMKPQRISGLALALACSSFSLLAQVPTTDKPPIPSTGKTTTSPVPPPPGQEKPIDRPSTVQGGAIAAAPAAAPKPGPVVIPDQKITTEGRMTLIRGMNAELGFARKPFPFGKSGLKIDAKTGQVTPDDQHLDAMMAGFGPAVKVGDRARI